MKPLAKQAGSALVWQAVQLVGGKLVYLIRIPILARLLAPDDFGLMAIAIIGVEFLMHATNFGMVPALVQRQTAQRGHYDSAWTVGLLRAFSVSVVVLFAAPLIAGVFAEPRATAVIRLLALRPLLQAAASIRVADLTRELRFRSLAVLSLSEALAATAVSIALAQPLGVWALVAGALVGPIVHSVLSYLMAPHMPRLSLQRSTTATLVRYGRWILAAELVALLGRSVLHVAISRRLGADQLGLYFLAAKLAFLPSEVATELIAKVAFPLYSRLQSEPHRAAQAFRVVVNAMAVVLIPALGLIIALAPSIVEELFGARWRGTAPIIRILAAACLVVLLNEAATPIFNGMGRPSRVVLIEAVQAAGLISLVWVLAAGFGLPGAAAAWIPAAVAALLVGLVTLRAVIVRPFAGAGRPLAAIAAVSVAGSSLAWGVDRLLPGLAGLLLGGLAAAVFICGSLWAIRMRIDFGLIDAVGRAWPRLGELLGRLGAVSGGVQPWMRG